MHQQNRTHHKARWEKGQLNNLGNKLNTTYALTIAKHDTNQQNPPLKTKTNYPRQNSHWNNNPLHVTIKHFIKQLATKTQIKKKSLLYVFRIRKSSKFFL